MVVADCVNYFVRLEIRPTTGTPLATWAAPPWFTGLGKIGTDGWRWWFPVQSKGQLDEYECSQAGEPEP